VPHPQGRTPDEPPAAPWGARLEQYRPYLELLARVQIGRRLQGKADPQDVVQETFLLAHQNLPRFRGRTEPEFLAWLRQILASRLAKFVRRYLGAACRDVRLEVELAAALDRSSAALERSLADRGSSPSESAARREAVVVVADALAKLPGQYRDVLILRHLEGLTFPEVAARLSKTEDAVQKLWARGVRALRDVIGEWP
jgi:RNA polymerase sigma-70 factor (ECF subfamily)